MYTVQCGRPKENRKLSCTVLLCIKRKYVFGGTQLAKTKQPVFYLTERNRHVCKGGNSLKNILPSLIQKTGSFLKGKNLLKFFPFIKDSYSEVALCARSQIRSHNSYLFLRKCHEANKCIHSSESNYFLLFGQSSANRCRMDSKGIYQTTLVCKLI